MYIQRVVKRASMKDLISLQLEFKEKLNAIIRTAKYLYPVIVENQIRDLNTILLNKMEGEKRNSPDYGVLSYIRFVYIKNRMNEENNIEQKVIELIDWYIGERIKMENNN